MIFTNDIVIKGECARIFRDLKEKFGFDFIDSFIYSSVLGVSNNSHIADVQTKIDDSIEINIPRNVLTSRLDKIDFISSMIVLIESSKENFEELIQLAFEDNSVETPKIYRMRRMEEYAISGSKLLEKELSNSSNIEILETVSDILSGIQL